MDLRVEIVRRIYVGGKVFDDSSPCRFIIIIVYGSENTVSSLSLL